MPPFLNEKFPNLKGSTQSTDSFDLYDYVGDSWSILLMHPGDYTPVCTTELGEVAAAHHEFTNRGVKVIGFSCSDAQQHRGWIRDIWHVTGSEVTFPILADPSRELAKSLGVLDTRNVDKDGQPLTVRAVFVLDKAKMVRLMMAYPASSGRNIPEILRAIDTLLLTNEHKVATPANWNKGNDVIVDYALTDAMSDKEFGKDNYRVVTVPSEQNAKQIQKHYLRYTKDPSDNS